ncbi:hypothetical protein E3N88_15908 [Mikania micrantha]|uniref:BURP domain-containing protein n=1 Tax=Mikania micrantha TaxID=192012 RepID=A0A5N6NY70_9ASTR|nr:hypothetical protein E3N88_15908 [Mikania micrantha]
MEFIRILTFLSLAMVVSYAAVAPETYWKSVLPNTPMPKAVTDLLNNEPEGDCEKIDVGKGGVIVRCHNKKKPVHVEVSPFSYKYAATDDQLKDDPNIAMFFLEKDMHQGNVMNLHFTKTTTPTSTFLPRNVADTIPFSSKKLPKIYKLFSVEPNTIESESMMKTINECEDKGIDGEDGTKVKAVAVCHTDTGKWNPKHLAFRVLNVKPGTTPVCHFLPEDHVVWVPY